MYVQLKISATGSRILIKSHRKAVDMQNRMVPFIAPIIY